MFKIVNKKDYQDLIDSRNNAEKRIEFLQKNIPTVKEYNFDSFLKEVLGREIRWIDTSKMDDESFDRWYNEAQVLLQSDIVRSLIGFNDPDGTRVNGEIVKDLMEFIAKDTRNFEEVMYARMKIVGIELLKTYLQELCKRNN